MVVLAVIMLIIGSGILFFISDDGVVEQKDVRLGVFALILIVAGFALGITIEKIHQKDPIVIERKKHESLKEQIEQIIQEKAQKEREEWLYKRNHKLQDSLNNLKNKIDR